MRFVFRGSQITSRLEKWVWWQAYCRFISCPEMGMMTGLLSFYILPRNGYDDRPVVVFILPRSGYDDRPIVVFYPAQKKDCDSPWESPRLQLGRSLIFRYSVFVKKQNKYQKKKKTSEFFTLDFWCVNLLEARRKSWSVPIWLTTGWSFYGHPLKT